VQIAVWTSGGQRVELLGERVDLLGQLGVALKQVGLELCDLVAVARRRGLVGLVGPRLRLLGDDHERADVEGDGREDQVQQDERGGVEAAAVQQAVPRVGEEAHDVVREGPREDDGRADDEEADGAHPARDCRVRPYRALPRVIAQAALL
jgi:hypothetical protein